MSHLKVVQDEHTIVHKRRFIVEVTVREHTHVNDTTLGEELVSSLAHSSLTYFLSSASQIHIVGEYNGD